MLQHVREAGRNMASLVPKLHLGTPVPENLYFAPSPRNTPPHGKDEIKF